MLGKMTLEALVNMKCILIFWNQGSNQPPYLVHPKTKVFKTLSQIVYASKTNVFEH